MRSQEQQRVQIASPSTEKTTGCYVYCLVPVDEAVSLGAVGIEGQQVYTVAHRDLGAVVHDCMAEPYQSEDAAVVADWVLVHHRVVETAWRRWRAVVPLTFNSIVRGEQGAARRNLEAWLASEYETLRRKLQALSARAEYAVQVFWDVALMSGRLAQQDHEIRALEVDVQSKPQGLAYLHRQKLKQLLRTRMETEAAERFRELYGRISRWTEAVRVERLGEGSGGCPMLMNLSCLVSREQCAELEAEMAEVGTREGLSIRLAGPLPPYSFC